MGLQFHFLADHWFFCIYAWLRIRAFIIVLMKVIKQQSFTHRSAIFSRRAMPDGIGPLRPLPCITLPCSWILVQINNLIGHTNCKIIHTITNHKKSYSFSRLVHFWIRFGIWPVKLLSPIRLQKTIKSCRLIQSWTFNLCYNYNNTSKTYKSFIVVSFSNVAGNYPVKLLEDRCVKIIEIKYKKKARILNNMYIMNA